MEVAVLLTCHNRFALTLACLEALFAQRLPPETSLAMYLVEDGCTDGTAEMVAERFPEVRLVHGDGSLYWCGGMRAAWRAATDVTRYDSYLWLNDDVTLVPNAISTLLTTDEETTASGRPGIILGSSCDPDTLEPTYGGFRGDTIVRPSLSPQICERMTGNIVLVPGVVFEKVGNLSAEFCHLYGDIDYGFRTRKAGFELWVAPRFLGYCRRNGCPRWADPSISLRERWCALHRPTVYPPRETYIFYKRHYKWRAIPRLVKLYLRVLSPTTWRTLKHLSATPTT